MKSPVTRDLSEIRAQIETFLKAAREPALLEPGEDLLPLNAENYEEYVLVWRASAWLQPANPSAARTSLCVAPESDQFPSVP